MAKILSSLALVVLMATPAAAQSQFYFGGIVAADSSAGEGYVPETFPAAGGFVGWRFSDAWSMEFHVDRGFDERTRQQIGFFGTDTLQDRAGEGYSVFAIWKSRPLGRVSAAVLMGISDRRFRTERTVGVDRPVPLPPDDALLQGDTRTEQAAGPTAGLMLPIAFGGGWSVAPEVRLGPAFMSEGGYFRIYSGVRMMWGF
jgi:hypothetical protein